MRPSRRLPVVYADVPLRRALQLLADALFLAAVVWAVRIGSAVEHALAEPAHRLRDSTMSIGSFSDQLSETAQRISEVPLLGHQIADPLDKVSATADQVSQTADSLSAALLTVSHQVGLLVLLSLAGAALVAWLPFRLRFAVRATRLRDLMAQPAAEHLLAARAFATASLSSIALIRGAETWHTTPQDPAVTRRLAELAVRPYGLRFRASASSSPQPSPQHLGIR